MSLELAAQHLASRGRKGDTMLVHMAPEEVSGLQALAMAAGGTLTLNPDTGLPEANFLKRMLPTLIGAGLMFATGGTAAPLIAGISNPALIGLGLGGLETARTGSLEKGLMAGLGAYGGAGLTGGLMGAGAGAAAPAMSVAPAAASPAATGLASSLSTGAAAPAMSMAPAVASPAATGLASSLAPATGTLSAGVKALGTEAGRSAALSSMGGGMGAAKYGLAALSPALQADAPTPYAGSGPNPYEYEYDPNNQTYTRVPVGTRQRDILRPTTPMMAAGGTVEEMSNRNQMETMMANGGQMFAAGGQVNLQGTFTANDQGGGSPFGQANANGYQAAGSGGPIQGFSSSFGQMGGGGNSNQLFSGGFGTPGGIDPRAVQADPQGFQRWMKMAQQREQQMPGSTMLGRPQGGLDKSHVIGPGHPMYGRTGATTPEELARMAASIAPQEQLLSDYKSQLQKPIIDAIHKAPAAPPSDNTLVGMGGTAESGFKSPGGISGQLGGFRSMPVGFFAEGGLSALAQGGPSHLGDYSDGGRLLKGPGDGVSDSIPATIANKRPARLADGEFVVPARIVSELGNGSTEAGARKLYAMMDRIQKARSKTTGKNRVAVNSRAEKLLPA